MKKFILCVVFMLGLAVPAQAGKINVVTTTTDLKAVADYIGGEKVKVYSLGKGNQNYHFLQAKPSYMLKAKKADLFIRIGLDLEIGYESLILEGSRNRNIQVGRDGHLDASEDIHPLETHEKVDRSMGDIHAAGNPHYWLDPLNMKIIAKNISNRLSLISPEDKQYFDNNLSSFNRTIDKKMREWDLVLSPYDGRKLVTYHKSWVYLANRFGLDIIDELEPKPGVPPSPTHLKEIIDVISDENVEVILQENLYKTKAANFVASKTGINVVVTPISVGGVSEVTDYFKLMDYIVESLRRGFENG